MTRPVLAVLAVLVLLASLPAVAAAETRTGGTVVVGPDETIDGDLETVAGSVVVRGTVTGDLEAVGGDVRIAESGAVDGNVDVAGGSISIEGTVGGDVEGGGGSIRVSETGRIGGSLEAGAGSIVVEGTVDGDARLGADTITLGPSAVIGGDLTYDGRLVRENGSTVEGTVSRDGSVQVGFDAPAVPAVPGVVFGVYGALVTLLVGAILLFAFPRFSGEVADRVAADPVRTGGIGFLAAVGTVVALLLLVVTIVGIPLSIAGFLLFGLLAWIGSVYGRYAVGAWLLSYTDEENRWLALVVGVLAVALLAVVPLFGALVEAVVFLLGFGALVLAMRERYRNRDRGTTEAGAPTDADAA